MAIAKRRSATRSPCSPAPWHSATISARAFEASAARPSTPRRRGETSVAAGTWASAAGASLPLALTRFIGREAELHEIVALINEYRLVTITGAGGVGKTQTALRAVMALSDTAKPNVCFVNLALIRTPSLVAAAIANALGVQEVPSQPPIETLIGFLKKKSMLLALDNCEHVIAEAANVVASLLTACPDLRILATSREPLRTAGERAYRLPSLDGQDAVALFVDRARAADAHFALAGEDNAIVVAICERLSCIPLAIELAAARVTILPLPMLAKAFADRFADLAAGERTAPMRRQTMGAAIDWSYELLTVAEQRLFERFSVFVGGCRIDAAQAVCEGGDVTTDGVLPLISSLVGKSLVVADLERDEPRYRLLEPFREYAREKLEARGEQHAVAHRHALAYLHLAEELRSLWYTRPSAVSEEHLYLEAGNWRQALEFSLAERSDVALGQRLMASAIPWGPLGAIEGRRWTALARDLIGEETPLQVVAGLSCVDASIANALREPERELASASTALEIYKDLDDEFGMAAAEALIADALAQLGRTNAEEAVLTALARARKLGVDRHVVWVLRVASAVSLRKGDISKARAQLTEAEAIAKVCGAENVLPILGLDRAECEFQAGNAELAVECATEALCHFLAVDNIAIALLCLMDLSGYLLRSKRYEEAEVRAREALTIASSQGVEGVATIALARLASIAAARAPSTPQQAPADRARAAQILGFLRHRVSSVGASYEFLEEYDRALDVLQRAMGRDQLEKFMSKGGTLTQDQAVDLALKR